jgi:hypothetical protein
MKIIFLKKTLVFGIILLFLGLAVRPNIATVQEKDNKIGIEPKEYLFQTIIDIAYNPDIQSLLDQSNNDLYRAKIDKSIYRDLLFSNPRFLFSVFLIKPSMTIKYLDNCYNKGIEITRILGEERVLNIIESIEIEDKEVLDEVKRIITNNKELSSKISFLSELNDYSIICFILLLLMIPILMVGDPFIRLFFYSIENSRLLTFIVASLGLAVINIFWLPIVFLYINVFDCFDYPYP